MSNIFSSNENPTRHEKKQPAKMTPASWVWFGIIIVVVAAPLAVLMWRLALGL